MFRVGVINTCYQSKELLEKSLTPWLEIRKNPSLVEGLKSLLISSVHGCFEETFSLGYPLKSTDGTIEYMDSLNIDEFYVYDTPQKEYDMWTDAYNLIKKEIDILFMVNSDEIWTIEEINKALKFVQFENYITYFDIHFKNYVGNEKTYIDGFQVPRIWNIDREGGLEGFYRDDRVIFKNGKKDIQCSNLVIPSVRPVHLSWCGSEDYLKRKLAFQNLRYKTCSYFWDEKNDCLAINQDYYKSINQSIPELHYDQ